MPRIDLRLARPDDDANERKLTTALDDLIHDEIGVVSAARVIDDIITKDCQRALAAYNSASEEQRTIPVPALYFEPERTAEKELWVLTRDNNYDGFGQGMWERHQGTFLGWRQVETDSDAAAAYRNFSAFLARLLSRGTAALLELSALVSPFVTRNVVAAASHEPHRFEAYVTAAAQWILYGGEVLHQMCEMRIMASVRWKKELWDSIRTKFEAIAGDDRFGTVARDWAAQAANCMRRIEERGSGHKRDAVDRHRFLRLEEE
ncbi:hypothetical protein LQW54_008658 [Pestalotiopsis sp. IQ-011]